MTTFEQLRAFRLFAPLDGDALTSLVEIASEFTFSPGERIIAEAEEGDACFFVLEGEAEVSVRGEVVATIGPSEAIGEMAALLRRPRTATVTASTNLRALAMDGESLRKLMRESPNFAAVVAREMSQRA